MPFTTWSYQVGGKGERHPKQFWKQDGNMKAKPGGIGIRRTGKNQPPPTPRKRAGTASDGNSEKSEKNQKSQLWGAPVAKTDGGGRQDGKGRSSS